MVIVTVCNQPFRDTYRQEYLKKGQKQIQKYPSLYSILVDFDKLMLEKYDHNIFLNFSSWSYEDEEDSDINKFNTSSSGFTVEKGLSLQKFFERKYYENVLCEMELLFKNEIILDTLKRSKRENIKAKMKSFDRDNNLGIFQEFYIFIHLKRNPGISDIIYDDFDDSNHDFRFSIKEVKFNLEVTSLGENEVKRILQKSFNCICERFIDTIPMESNIQLNVNIKSLKNENDKFNEKYITKLLSKTIQRILPIIITPETSGHFDKDFLGDASCTLFQFYKFYLQKRLGCSHFPIIKTFDKISKTEEGLEYLKNTKTDDLIDIPIVNFTNFKAEKNKKCFTLSSWQSFPSGAEEERIEAHLNQFKRRIEDKFKKNQLENQNNPILVIQFADIFFQNYSYDDLSKNDFLKRITPIVNRCFEDLETPTKILGVIIYEEDLKKGIFIENPKIVIEDKTKSTINLITRVISR